MRSKLIHLVLSLSMGLALLVPASEARAELTCGALPEFVNLFLRGHVLYSDLDDELERRAVENYILSMDRSRTLLTEAEARALQESMAGVFDEIRTGRCSRITDVHKEFVRRHEAAAKLVRAYVSRPDYTVDESASLVLDPEERGYPKTPAERDELTHRLVHFQMSNYVSNGTEMEEAKEKLVRRYERRLKRALELSKDEVYSGFLDSFASALDPHSNYLSAKVLEDFRIGMSLSLEGIGVALSEQDGYAVAERIIPGGAAERHGKLKPKDKIIAVAQEDDEFVDIIDMPLRDAVTLIRGKAGTTVGLTVLRQGEQAEKFNIRIVRDKIDLAEQAAKLRFEERDVNGQAYKLAILELPSFYGDSDPTKRQCTDDVKRLLAEVNEAKADGLLLDLSRNGGGLLQHAVTISGFFIREGEVVGIEDARGRRQILADRDEDVLYSGPMVVYTSRVSASASEILAGALKDYGRAVIVGDDHTFGKGTVQTVSQLPGNNGALKVTTALFYRPGGQSTQHAGVGADVVVPSLLSSDDYGEKTQRFSLPPQRTSPFIGDEANAKAGDDRWDPIHEDLTALLSERSATRQADDTEFMELREQLAEARDDDGVVLLSELLKEREERNGKKDDEGEATDEGAAAEAEPAAEAAEAKPDEAGKTDGETTPDTETAAADEEEDPSTPQLEEALRVLTDLVTLSQQRSVARKEPRPES
jgi:carboxyl-terminal processing protease